jgi:SAM-dependent methyltransferase
MKETILDTGCRDGIDIISDALENEERVYFGLDKEENRFLDSPEKIYRFFIGQMVYRSFVKLGKDFDMITLPPNDVYNTVFYLAQDYQKPDCEYQSDKEAVDILESHEMGRLILDCPIKELTMGNMELEYSEFMFKNHPEVLDMSVRDLILNDPPPELVDKLASITKRINFVTGDLRKLPFSDASFDYVHSSATSDLYENDSNIKEAQRVLKPGKKLVKIPFGINTVKEEVSDSDY